MLEQPRLAASLRRARGRLPSRARRRLAAKRNPYLPGACADMQLPDEAISYHYQSLLVPPAEEWTCAAELRARHFLPPNALKDLVPRLLQVRSQVAAERELRQVPPEMQPLDAGFIDLPQKTLEQDRRQKEA